jgi:hypothetical protein
MQGSAVVKNLLQGYSDFTILAVTYNPTIQLRLSYRTKA